MLRRVAMHIIARFYEVRSKRAWSRYRETDDLNDYARSMRLAKRAGAFRRRVSG